MARGALGAKGGSEEDDDGNDDDARSVRSSYSTSSLRSAASYGLTGKGGGWSRFVSHTNDTPRHTHQGASRQNAQHQHQNAQHQHQNAQHQHQNPQHQNPGAQGRGKKGGKGKGKNGKGNTKNGHAYVKIPGGMIVHVTKQNADENFKLAIGELFKWNVIIAEGMIIHPWIKGQDVVTKINAFKKSPGDATYNAALDAINTFQENLKDAYGVKNPTDLIQEHYLNHLKKFESSAEGKRTYESLRTNLGLTPKLFKEYLTSGLYSYVLTAVSKAIYEKNFSRLKAALQTSNANQIKINLIETKTDQYHFIHESLDMLHRWQALFYTSESVAKKGTNTKDAQHWAESEEYQKTKGVPIPADFFD